MKWFQRWRDRRAMKLMRAQFKEFIAFSTFAKQMPKEDAFRFFCQLEAMGEPAVRDMLKRGVSFEVTLH